MNIYIIDDNYVIAEKIKKIIQNMKRPAQLNELKVQIVDKHFLSELDDISVSDTDIYIVDIDLKQYYTGIDLAKQIRELNDKCFIMFVTSYENKAIHIINNRIDPFAYIVKEIDEELFVENIEKQMNNIYQQLSSRVQKEELFIFKVGNQSIFVTINDILYISSIKGYKHSLLLKLKNEEHMIDGSLKKLKPLFTSSFIYKDFKAFILNMNNISSISRNEEFIKFINGDTLEMSASSIDKLKKAYKHKIKGE